jgi:hypothetical protein
MDNVMINLKERGYVLWIGFMWLRMRVVTAVVYTVMKLRVP